MKSMRTRLVALLLAGISLTLAAGGAAVYWISRAAMLDQLDAGLESRAHTLASLVAFEPGRAAFEAGALVFDSGDAPAPVLATTYFELRDSTGAALKRSSNLGDASLPADAPPEGRMRHQDVVLSDGVSGRVALYSFRPRIDEDPRPTPPGFQTELLVLAAAIERRPVDDALAALLTTLLIVGGGIGAVTIPLIVIAVRAGLSPLEFLGRQLAGVSSRTISMRLDGAGVPRELEPVYREVNAMLDRVERALERERSFADATAHELRTPLAELRATAEVSLRWPEPERAAASLAEILSIGQEMERMVESLLLISRGRAPGAALDSSPVDLEPIVHRVLERESGTIEAKGIGVTVDLNGGAAIHAPREAVEVIVRNLINNAVHYTPPGGHLVVRSPNRNGHPVAVEVQNGPVDLRSADLPLLFRPFWRADGARSDRSHAGLGLAVVQQLARATGLEIDATLEGTQLSIRITGPNG